MIHRLLPCGVTALATLAAGLAPPSGPAAADSIYFGYSSGHRQHRHHHHHYPYYRYGYYHPAPYYYPPASVYYAPPPPVVYVPAAPPPLAAMPASPPYRAANGQYCREYQATVMVNGAPQPSYGTACLQPDGAWRVVN